MNNQPIVSIIIPCYNQGRYISETLDCLLKQSYENWEAIIVNDGSTDYSESIIEKWLKLDRRFKYINKDNEGVAIARNIGIKSAIGEFVLPLDADDLISQDYIEKCIQLFRSSPQIKLIYPIVELFGNSTGKWNLPEYSYKALLLDNMIVCSGMFKRSDFLKTNGYDPQFVHGLEDWEFWISFLSPDDIVYKIPETHFFYRIKEVSRNSSLKNEHIAEASRKIYSKHINKYNEILGSMYGNPLLILRDYINLRREYELTINCPSYRIGKTILSPFKLFKKLLSF